MGVTDSWGATPLEQTEALAGDPLLPAATLAPTSSRVGARPSPGDSRLIVRRLFAPSGGRVGAAVLRAPLAVGDLVMMRRRLLNLKQLAERDATAGPAP